MYNNTLNKIEYINGNSKKEKKMYNNTLNKIEYIKPHSGSKLSIDLITGKYIDKSRKRTLDELDTGVKFEDLIEENNKKREFLRNMIKNGR